MTLAQLRQLSWLAGVALVALNVGCRGRAHDDLYAAKLANEIRILEDQLYDADYQNRVLRDQLQQSRNRASVSQPKPSSAAPPTNMRPFIEQSEASPDYEVLDARQLEEPRRPQDRPEKPESDSGNPFLDDGKPRSSPPLTLPVPPPLDSSTDGQPEAPAAENSESGPPQQRPLVDPPNSTPPFTAPPARQGLGMPSETEPRESVPVPVPDSSNTGPDPSVNPLMELPEPRMAPESVPPGEAEPLSDEIVPGPPAPPKGDPRQQPDKIELPPDANIMQFKSTAPAPIPVPDHLELHDGLSGGHQLDGDSDIDGLFLVLTVQDADGKVLSLDQFDVDAELSVVVLDPKDQSGDSRVGRWDFNPDQVRGLVRKAPVDGIHIPIAWQDRLPKGDDVIVHIRLAAAEEEMRCQGRVRLEESVAMSNWLPRG